MEICVVCNLWELLFCNHVMLITAEYQNYDDARQSEEYIKEIERLDSTLLPRVSPLPPLSIQIKTPLSKSSVSPLPLITMSLPSQLVRNRTYVPTDL